MTTKSLISAATFQRYSVKCQSFPMPSLFVIHLKVKKRPKGNFYFSLAKSILNRSIIKAPK